MCGITGWINFQRDLRIEKETIEKMAHTLSKRGPDDTNIWSDVHVAFGHKRLVVVDPAGGVQPMTRTKDGKKYTVCYNGELYNTEDLRNELLKRGYTFQGHSDTEVLLTSYMEWKEECVHHLNGIFAFAVWDEEKEQLFIGRDRLGVKPLFYRYEQGDFLFGSELKAILAHPNVQAEIDREGLCEIFALGPSRTPGHGVFSNISELRPAHALTVSKDGLRRWRYWNVQSAPHTDSLDETVARVRFLLTDSITRQLVSDVPVCTFLSGGVDSSAITAVTAQVFAKEGKGHLHTYSIDYEENEKYFEANLFQPNADGPWIEKMSTTFETIHHRCIISQKELADHLIEAMLVRDLPGMADIDSSLLWFCQKIKENFVVSLSGECADEIFGGYPWFHREEDFMREGFPWMRSLGERIGLLNDSWQGKLTLDEYAHMRYRETLREVPRLEGENPIEAKRRELFYLNMIWFMTTLLDRKDRMSMGASLEVRVPFADHRLVEYVWNIPWEMKMYENREKGILRKALEGILPNEILYRKKSPYPKTHHPLYTKMVTDRLKEVLENRSSVLYEFFDRQKLQELVETGGKAFKIPWFGQLMSGPQLLAYLIQFDAWFTHYHIVIKDS
ncbi:asparagine synthase (glutamine-hydrolysing) [Thermolongibacillus altinsuensis]|uniref:asparagine synthase (glutamine-hydrolyzing) n=1 Tax=Thermolongibacillus altinsuensis TaxID=575256 RepID=A0A4R1QF74_9BACL|nr:asparagine synthase (glutamine-hydrolyzing) [Thermolongibacillus altinsuensis]TCL51064.1 asparagine synthase (glutamine-hydrolysing) [Thermolongibacillus altinsuensis]